MNAALDSWKAALPDTRGRLTFDAPLGRLTWFGVGGTAEVLFRPADVQDLGLFLAGLPAGVPVQVVGVGSNLLVRDGGVPGVVIRLGKSFAGISVEQTRITAGGAALDMGVAMAALDANIGGLEFLSGVPGSIGGALRMNAGAFGGEMKDVTLSAEVMDPHGTLHTLSADDMGFAYRRAAVPEGWIFISALLEGHPDDHDRIARRMAEIRAARDAAQPKKVRTGGSTFANPPGAKAWELIDRAGCRGLAMGGAMVSDKHCNFLINTGTATAAEIEDLGEEVRRRVREDSGIELVWEIRRIGRRSEGGEA